MNDWFVQVGRALTRLLNAICGGQGDCTFSAWSWELQRQGSRWGRWRVAFVDWLMKPGHCYRAWLWHDRHDLLGLDDANVD